MYHSVCFIIIVAHTSLSENTKTREPLGTESKSAYYSLEIQRVPLYNKYSFFLAKAYAYSVQPLNAYLSHILIEDNIYPNLNAASFRASHY